MNNPSRLPAGRMAAEFAVIVVGVLLALAVDGWVASIDEHDRQVAFLTDLRSDFEANRESALNNAIRHRELEQLGSLLLNALESGVWEDAPEQIVLAAELSGYIRPGSYARGAWDDARATGVAALTADPELRIALSDFYLLEDGRSSLWAEFKEHYMSYRYMARDVLPPTLRVEMARSFSGWFTEDFTEGPFDYLARQDLASTVNAILGTPRLAVPLADVVMARRVTAVVAEGDAERIGEIIRMIDRALAAL